MTTAHVQHSSLIYSSLKEHMFAEETDIGGGGEGGRKGRRQRWRCPSTTSLIQLSRRSPKVTPRGQTLSLSKYCRPAIQNVRTVHIYNIHVHVHVACYLQH